MPAFWALLDANVIIPAALRDTLLRAAEAALFRVYWSDAILGEVQRNLVENSLTTAEQARALVNVLCEAFPEASVSGFEHLVDAMTNHPKDRHVLAAAVVAGAEVIVTTNLTDFAADDLKPFSITAQSPDAFLSALFDIDPTSMVDVVVSQAADLQAPPMPMTVDDVLDALAVQHAPTFAALVRGRLAL